ncbi:unnamed protein product [Amaranthus hypochondriacus]
MSPALLDTGASNFEALNQNKGQIFDPSSISLLGFSGLISKDQIDITSISNMNSHGQSGFLSSSDLNAKFEFSTPSTSKVGVENPTFSSISSLTRPRMTKSRKSHNPRSIGNSETRKIDPGFNPFRPVSNNLIGKVSSSLSEVGNDDNDVLNNSSKNLNSKVTSKVDKVGNALIDEIRKMRIEDQIHSNLSGNNVSNTNLPSELHDKIKMLNLGGSVGKDSGAAFDNVGTSLASELPNGLERLKIQNTGEVGSSSFVFGTSDSSFVFGSNRTMKDSTDPMTENALPNMIKNLHITESDKNCGTRKEMNVNKDEHTFIPLNSCRTESGVVDSMIVDNMEKLKIRDNSRESSGLADVNWSSSVSKEVPESMKKEQSRMSYPTETINPVRKQDEHSTGPQIPNQPLYKGSGVFVASASTSSFAPAGPHSQLVRHDFEVPYTDDAQKNEGFVFGCKQESVKVPHVEFRTPDSKGNLFTGQQQQMGFITKKGLVKDIKSKGRKTKVKEPKPVLIPKSLRSNEDSIHDEPSDSYSPMDVSPHCQTEDDGREPPLTSENQSSIDSHVTILNDAIDEDLIRATENMDINEGNDVNHGETKDKVSECSDNAFTAMENSPVHCVSASENASFMSASENFDETGDNEVESNVEEQSSDQFRCFSASTSASIGGSSFTFAASSSAQGLASAAMRQFKKKNRLKAGSDIFVPPRTAVLSDTTSSQFSPISRVSVLPSQVVQNNDVITSPSKGGNIITPSSSTTPGAGGNVVADAKKVTSSPTALARAAQEACEKWRLRGNQAYANGDLEKAEDCYSQGLSSIPQHETSRDCIRALVLCYSNRAAARMSRGRMREALQDCLVAAELDPNFFRVQLRAANCYLALGEICDASLYFKKLLQSTDICVERKIILDASDGLQKAQKVYDSMDRSSGLLLQKTYADAESALGVIAEALAISPYSEKMLESKAEALFTLRRYEEVIQLCAQTMDAAEKNSPSLVIDGQSSYLEASELLKCYSFRLWRYSFIFKSNFYLGKLEEAIDFLEKQECWKSMGDKFGKETLESLIPLLSIARELINHKSAGNAAFQAGKHKEAVEHYTAALSFNVESRPFSAVCFANRAAAYQALGQITDAIADCSLAIALDVHYMKAISRRAALFEMIRDYELAAKDLERLVSLLTKQAEEKHNHSGTYLSKGSVTDLRQAQQRLYQMEEQARRGIPLNFYLILGVESSVTAAELKKAYRKAALRHHPDKAGQSLARAEIGDDSLWKEIAEGVYKDADKLFKMIGEAYAVLSDPDKRSQYDIEEETRTGQRKTSTSASRTHAETSFNAAERSGIGRPWREMRRSSAYPYSRGFEPTRPGKYY